MKLNLFKAYDNITEGMTVVIDQKNVMGCAPYDFAIVKKVLKRHIVVSNTKYDKYTGFAIGMYSRSRILIIETEQEIAKIEKEMKCFRLSRLFNMASKFEYEALEKHSGLVDAQFNELYNTMKLVCVNLQKEGKK